jgi:hypothetical protein
MSLSCTGAPYLPFWNLFRIVLAEILALGACLSRLDPQLRRTERRLRRISQADVCKYHDLGARTELQEAHYNCVNAQNHTCNVKGHPKPRPTTLPDSGVVEPCYCWIRCHRAEPLRYSKTCEYLSNVFTVNQ